MRLDGQVVAPLHVEGESPAGNIVPEGGQEAVIVSRASAETVTITIERQARDQDPIDLLGLDFGAASTRFGDAKGAATKFARRVDHMIEPQSTRPPIDPWQDEPSTALEHALDHRSRVDLFWKRRGVKHHGQGVWEAGHTREPLDQCCLLERPKGGIKGSEARDRRQAESGFARGRVHAAPRKEETRDRRQGSAGARVWWKPPPQCR
jgi:hypothetical protein